jgi:glycosyltransferase involved in cell wall biosynthesis
VLTTTATPWAVLDKIGAGWSTGLSVEELQQGLRAAVATTAAERAAMGRRGRNYVSGELGWSQVAAMTLAAYRWLLDPQSGRPAHVHLN